MPTFAQKVWSRWRRCRRYGPHPIPTVHHLAVHGRPGASSALVRRTCSGRRPMVTGSPVCHSRAIGPWGKGSRTCVPLTAQAIASPTAGPPSDAWEDPQKPGHKRIHGFAIELLVRTCSICPGRMTATRCPMATASCWSCDKDCGRDQNGLRPRPHHGSEAATPHRDWRTADRGARPADCAAAACQGYALFLTAGRLRGKRPRVCRSNAHNTRGFLDFAIDIRNWLSGAGESKGRCCRAPGSGGRARSSGTPGRCRAGRA